VSGNTVPAQRSGQGTVALVVFTRDLRVRDNPALAAAVRTSARVLPLFVLDDAILARPSDCPNRLGAHALLLGRRERPGWDDAGCGEYGLASERWQPAALRGL
jgi:hypothetical protein